MNSTLVDNAILEFLIESTKAHINARLTHAQSLSKPDFFTFEIEQLKQEIKHLSKLDPKFVRQCEISIGAIEIISNTEL